MCVSLFERGEKAGVEDIMDFPCGWQPEAVYKQRQDLDNLKGSETFGGELLAGVL